MVTRETLIAIQAFYCAMLCHGFVTQSRWLETSSGLAGGPDTAGRGILHSRRDRPAGSYCSLYNTTQPIFKQDKDRQTDIHEALSIIISCHCEFEKASLVCWVVTVTKIQIQNTIKELISENP